MPRERLIALLDEVRDELERADAAGESELDDETAAKLRAVDGDIRGWLDDEDDDDEESFVERTQEAIAVSRSSTRRSPPSSTGSRTPSPRWGSDCGQVSARACATIRLAARSANAATVRLGFTPMFEAIADASVT